MLEASRCSVSVFDCFLFIVFFPQIWASLVAQLVKKLPAMRETWVQSLGWEDPLEKGKATHSSILAWRIPCTVQSMGSQRVGHDWATFTHFLKYINFTDLTKIMFLLFFILVDSLDPIMMHFKWSDSSCLCHHSPRLKSTSSISESTMSFSKCSEVRAWSYVYSYWDAWSQLQFNSLKQRLNKISC